MWWSEAPRAGRLAAVAAALWLAGCGFQLRGEPQTGIKAQHLSTATGSGVYTEIRRALAAGPTRLVPTPSEGEAHLRILGEGREKTVATITGTGRVYEYQLRLVVDYEMLAPGREVPLIAPTRTEARRLITYSETAPIAKEAEEQLLYKDMQVELASRRLVEVRIPSGKPGLEGARAIESYCARLPEDTFTLVVLPELDWQQHKSRWFEALERAGVLVEARSVTREELPDWLAERLARQGQSASVETLEWLADRVEGNLLAARQEVEKLGLLLPRGEIGHASIREAVSDVSRFERDALLEAVHAGDATRIARVVSALEAGGEPLPLLLWALTEEVRLAMAFAAGQRPRRFLPPERVSALQHTARRHDAASFDRLLLQAHCIDRMIKGVETGDPWDGIADLALALAGKPVLAAA